MNTLVLNTCDIYDVDNGYQRIVCAFGDPDLRTLFYFGMITFTSSVVFVFVLVMTTLIGTVVGILFVHGCLWCYGKFKNRNMRQGPCEEEYSPLVTV